MPGALVVSAESGAHLAGAMDFVFIGRQLFDTDRSAGMQLAVGYADFRAHAELAAIGELG